MNAEKGIIASMEVPDFHNRRFAVYVTLPSLQRMAAYSVAQAISHRCSPFMCERAFENVVCSLGLPRSFSTLLRSCLLEMEIEMGRWRNCNGFYIDCDPKYCIWYPNGKLDCEKTAVKMLSNPALSVVQKFVIMSEYCLEDQIVAFDVKSLPNHFVKYVHSIGQGTTYYWMCRLKNKLNKVPLDGFSSVEAVMASKYNTLYAPAFEYFWRRLNDDDRFSITTAIFSDSHSMQDLAALFSMLSHDQQLSLLYRIPVDVLTKFILYDYSYFPYTFIWAWKNYEDVITVEQFAEVAKVVLFDGKNVLPSNRMDLLVELWQLVSDYLRNNAQTILRKTILSIFSQRPTYFCKIDGIQEELYSPSYFKFLCLILSAEDVDFRRTALLENPYFGAVTDVRFLSELIDLCLPNLEDQVEFKSKVVELEEMKYCCLSMLRSGDFEELRFKLNYYLPDLKPRQKFQKHVIHLVRTFDEYQRVKVSWWNQFNNFISETYARPAMALKMMKRFAYKIYWDIAEIAENVSEFITIAQSIFVGEELTQFRRKILEFVISMCTKPTSDYTEFRYPENIFRANLFSKVVPWCMDNDEEAIRLFKNEYLPVDVIFNRMVRRLVRYDPDSNKTKVLVEKNFVQWNDCLKWYLADDDRIKEYKLQWINSSEGVTTFKGHSEVITATALIEVLKWLFHGDETAVREFIRRIGMS